MSSAAASQMVAAVVKPPMRPPSRRIVPAPKKPMPVTMLDAIRVVLSVVPAMEMENRVYKVEPIVIKMIVPKPGDDPDYAWVKETWKEKDPRLPLVSLDMEKERNLG